MIRKSNSKKFDFLIFMDIEKKTSEDLDFLRNIKQQFYVYRNGMMAESLRTSGNPCKVIFGLNIPQIAEIARSIKATHEQALTLWNDKEVRESRIIATYLFKADAISKIEAIKLIEDVRTPEEADMLSFRLLKHLPFAHELVSEYSQNTNPLLAYLSRSLSRHLE